MRMSSVLRSSLVGACAGLAMLCSYAAVVASEQPDVDVAVAEKLEVIRLLKEEDFKELENRFAKIAERVEINPTLDLPSRRLLSAFFRADPEIIGPMNRWRETHPKSFAPHLAFGLYSAHVGWVMRGEKTARYTNAKRFEEMKNFFVSAVDALQIALKLNPKVEVAWETLINIEKARGGHHAVELLFDEAIGHLPKSSRVYGAYYEAIAPKWQGSAAQQFALRARMTGMFPGNSDFAWVADVDEIDLAWDLLRGGKSQEALEKFDELISRREYVGSRYGRAWALRELARHEEAVAEFQQVVAMDPGNARYRFDLAKAQSVLRSTWHDARRNMDIALSLDPYNPRMLIRRADFLRHHGNASAAKKDLDNALFLGALDDDVRDARRQYFLASGDLNAAVAEAEKMVMLVPANLVNYLSYGFTLQANKDCRAIDAFQTYLNACPILKECGKDQEQHIALLMNGMKMMCS